MGLALIASALCFAARNPQASVRQGLSFEPNLGQADARVRYLARAGAATVGFLGSEAVLALARGSIRLQFAGGRDNATFEPLSPLQSFSAYFRGNDPARWIPRVQHYARLRARGVYPGIDVVYYDAGDGRLEFDLIVAPGADASRIRLRVPEATGLRLDSGGNLLISTPSGDVKQTRPHVYQTDAQGRKRTVAGAYRIAGKSVSFQIGEHDQTKALILDPVLIYSTLLGSGESAGIAVDAAGAAYITGWTAGTFSLLSPLPGQATVRGTDVFVSKLVYNASNTLVLAYSTYLGGSSSERGAAIAVDATGAAYITGRTSSADFPVVNPIVGGGQLASPQSAFVTKLVLHPNTNILSIAYSTFLGGGTACFGRGIAVDAAGAAYVTGYTMPLPAADPFPTVLALPSGEANQGLGDAFLSKLAFNASTNALVLAYSTMLGGDGDEEGTAVAVDGAGAAILAGRVSPGVGAIPFPVVNPLPGPSGPRGGSDVFVAKIVQTPTPGSAVSLAFSTLLGGAGTDEARGVAVDSAGSVYVAGFTSPPPSGAGFPVVNPLNPGGSTPRGGDDAFVAKIAVHPVSGSVSLAYSTLLGGNNTDQARGIAVDVNGNAYVAGETASPDFPVVNAVSPGGSTPPAAGVSDGFAARLAFQSGVLSISYSTLLGGDNIDTARGVAVDSAGSAYVTGESLQGGSRAFPFQAALTPAGTTYRDSTFNVFAVKLADSLPPTPRTLTVVRTGSGTVTSTLLPNPIDCGVVCTMTGLGTVTLIATPAAGFVFQGWSGACTGKGGCQVRLDQDRTVTTEFVPGVTLSVFRAGDGAGRVASAEIDCGDVCLAVVPVGTAVTLIATPSIGFVFTGWSGGCSGQGTCSLTLNVSVGVTATFSRSTAVSAGLMFFPLATPCRAVDTRLNDGAYGLPAMNGLETRAFVLAGRCGIPADAAAYALNVTVVPKEPLAFLTIFPSGQALPVVSTLNSLDARVKANAAIVPAGVGGSVSVYVTGRTELVLDVNGYFAPSVTGGYAFYGMNPCRIVDTRLVNGSWGSPNLGALQTRTIPIQTSPCPVPSTATAYSLNVTVVPSTVLAFLTVWPAGPGATPVVSTLNSLTGTVVANAALVRAGETDWGGLKFYSTNPAVLVLDINGFFAPPILPNALTFYPVSPCRILDTRGAAGPTGGPALGAQQARDVHPQIAGCGIPATARAYSLNATVVPPTGLAYLTMWPAGQNVPIVSTLNATDGSITANAAIVPAGQNGGISVFATSVTHLVLDINGYFAP